MSNPTKVRRWLLQNLLGWALASPLVFLALPHLLFGIAVRPLLSLWLDETIVFLAASPMLYWSAKRARVQRGSKALATTVGVVLVVFLLVIWHYANLLGVIGTESAYMLTIVSLVSLPVFIIGGYLLGPKMAQLPERLTSHGDGDPNK